MMNISLCKHKRIVEKIAQISQFSKKTKKQLPNNARSHRANRAGCLKKQADFIRTYSHFF